MIMSPEFGQPDNKTKPLLTIMYDITAGDIHILKCFYLQLYMYLFTLNSQR